MKKYKHIYGMYVKEDELKLIKHKVPEYYIDSNIDKNVDFNYAQKFLQNENDNLNSKCS